MYRPIRGEMGNQLISILLPIAIIRPHRFQAVREALCDVDDMGLTTSECRGTGRQRAVAHTFRGPQYASKLGVGLHIDVVVDEALEVAVEAIQQAASTGGVGDGKIFITEWPNVVRVRIGDRGIDALS